MHDGVTDFENRNTRREASAGRVASQAGASGLHVVETLCFCELGPGNPPCPPLRRFFGSVNGIRGVDRGVAGLAATGECYALQNTVDVVETLRPVKR